MSFWTADDKIPVRQTKVAIPAENGLDFTASQTVHITIPPNIEFFQPKETYLHFDLQISDTGLGRPTKLQLDKQGGSVVIRDIRISSGGAGGVLLEEIQSYNVLTALRYDYEQTESLRNKRGLVEGGSQHNPKSRSTFHNNESDTNNCTDSLYFDALNDGHAAQTTAHVSNKVKMLLPLHTGIFQNDKVFPALLTDGLRLEILLESAPRCLVPLSTVSDSCTYNSKCYFHSLDGIDDNMAAAAVTAIWDAPGVAVNDVWIRRDNQQVSAENFPFSVGETFDFVDVSQPVTDGTQALNTNASIIETDVPMVIASIRHYAYSGNSAAVGGKWGLTRINLAAPVTRGLAANNNRQMGGGGNDAAGATWVMVSRALTQSSTAEVATLNYTISDVELLIQKVEMPSGYTSKLMKMMKGGGSLNYDFLSYRNYKYSALSGDVQVNMRLPLVESRAKAILSIPTDSQVYTQKTQIQGTPCDISGAPVAGVVAAVATTPAFDAAREALYAYNYKNDRVYVDGTDHPAGAAAFINWPHYSQRSGLVGIWDYLSNYQLFYGGKLNPSRKVDTTAVASGDALSQQWAIEAEKSLAMSNIRPLSFRALHENAFIGRALALQDGVYDARGKDFNLQLAYEGTAPIKNKLWNNFVAHLRRIVVKGNQISLEV
jgi:hypothetical protein